MKETLRYIALVLVLLAVAALFGYVAGYNAIKKDVKEHTEIHYNTKYRDTTIYNIDYKDSTIVDWHLKPIEHFSFDTIHDTAYILIPISSYHFDNDLADVWCRGYDVTLDSLRVHMKETIIENTVTIREPSYCNMIGVDAGLYDASIIYIRSVGRLSLGISAGYTFDRHATARGLIGYNF